MDIPLKPYKGKTIHVLLVGINCYRMKKYIFIILMATITTGRKITLWQFMRAVIAIST
jgi:hypothetical protein